MNGGRTGDVILSTFVNSKHLLPIYLTVLQSASVFSAVGNDLYSVTDFGAKGDAKTDDTASFQKALDTAGKAGGGAVLAPRGNYFFAGHLNIPNAVTLKGIWESVPSHIGIRNPGAPKPTDDGTTFLVTESAGTEEGPPFITLNDNSTLKGVVIYYPRMAIVHGYVCGSIPGSCFG